MHFFSQLFSKILWAALFILLLAGGYIYIVKNFVKPPIISNNLGNSSTASQSNSFKPIDIDSGSTAITQQEGEIIDIPDNFESGSLLNIYSSADNLNPLRIRKTNGLEMISLDNVEQAQEAEGYFLVSEAGEYNFTVDLPSGYKDVEIESLFVKVDGLKLKTPTSGQIYLEEGYHKISLFNSYPVQNNYPRINWATVGEKNKPLEVFREAKNN